VKDPVVSVVLPVYNERESLPPLLEEIAAALRDVPHEVVAVDDGSTDGSLDELRRLRARHPRLRVVAFEANAGQSAAFAAGVDAAAGEVVVLMDADGQNDPADIPGLLEALAADPSLAAVAGYRAGRADSWWKLLQSRIANRVRNWMTGDTVRDTGCSLKAIRGSAMVTLPRFNGMHRFLPTLVRTQGGAVAEVPVSHRPRQHGRSKYGMWNRAARGLRDALGVRWLRRRALRFAIRGDST
jgi:glycosyltransferase involved in cell wall biosynthesis